MNFLVNRHCCEYDIRLKIPTIAGSSKHVCGTAFCRSEIDVCYASVVAFHVPDVVADQMG